MSKNLDSLKSKSRLARQRLTAEYGDPSPSKEQANLSSLFSDVLAARGEMLSKFSDLLSLRVTAYESALSGYISSYYTQEISSNLAAIDVLFRAVEVVSSAEFARKFDEAVFVVENSYNEYELGELAEYFGPKFDEIVSIAFDEGADVEYVVGTGLREDSVTVSPTPKDNPNRVYLLLEILGKLKNIENESITDDISELKSLISSDGQGSTIPSLLKDNISSRAKAISDLVESKRFMDSQRSQRDPFYSAELSSDATSKIESIMALVPIFSDLSPEGISLSRENGTYDKMASASSAAISASDDLISDSLSAISEMEDYLDDYLPFIRLPVEETTAISAAVLICEEATTRFQQQQEPAAGSFFSPFSTASGGRSRLSFSDWTSRTTQSRRMNGSQFDMLMLYMGTAGRTFLSEPTAFSLSNKAFSTMSRRGMIRASELKSQYRDASRTERDLVESFGIRLSERPGDEPAPFWLKSILPGTEIIDYIDFSDALLFSTGAVNQDEVGLRNTIRTVIIESFGKVRKESLAETISRSVSAAGSSGMENLKGLYCSICFREAIEEFNSYLDGLGDYLEETRIDQPTKAEIEGYLALNTTEDQTFELFLDDILSKYNAAHAALYGSGSSGDLLDDALVSGSELRQHLLG